MAAFERSRTYNTGTVFCRGAILLIAVGMICTFPAAAGRKPSQPAGLVTFQMSALGPNNEPVTDLRRGECQLSEDGKRQTIAFLHYDGNNRRNSAPAGPQEFSNREGFAGHPTVVLLDLLSENLLTWVQAEAELVKALEGVPSGEGLYVYILMNQGAFYAVHALPKTQAELRAASPAWTKEVRPLLDGVSRELAGFRPIDDQDPWWRTQLTMRALRQFASTLGAMPGRINVVWITHGVPSVVPGVSPDQPVDLGPELRNLGESFAQSGIALYTVAQSANGAGQSMGDSWDTLQLLSQLTGGRSYASDRVENAIAAAMADARASYLAGYYPTREKDDGKYHKLRMTCARTGVRLQTRQGYRALAVQPGPAAREQAALQAAAGSRFDNPGIGLRVTLLPTDRPLTTARVRIHVDPADLVLPDRNDPSHGDLAVNVAAYAHGTVQHATATSFQPGFTPGQSQQAAGPDIEIAGDVAVDGMTQSIRVVVFDRNSNLTGSITIPVNGTNEEDRKSSDN